MKLLAVSGSRNHDGQTARLLTAVCKGFAEAGGTTESVFLPDLKIERCRQCDPDGWGPCRRTHTCIIEDDFQSLLVKIKSADVLVFANPVYFGDLSESMRTLLERLRRTNSPGGPAQAARPGQQAPAAPNIQQPRTPAVGICLAGGRGFGSPGCCAILDSMLQGCGFEIIDMIAARRQNIELKLSILDITGKWLVKRPLSNEGNPPPRE